jgi:microsomal dipeptidase-like Zn-dependent dipeptidase
MSKQNTPDWKDLHYQQAVVADLHAHPALKAMFLQWYMSLRHLNIIRSVYFPLSIRTNFDRLDMGGVDLLFSSSYAPEHQILDDFSLLQIGDITIGRLRQLRYIPFLWVVWWQVFGRSYYDVTRFSINELSKRVAVYNRTKARDSRSIQLIKSVGELDTIFGQDKPKRPIAIINSVEGAHCLEGKSGSESEILANLENFFKDGVAYLTLAHFYPNKVANPTFPYPEFILKQLRFSRRQAMWRDLSLGLTPLGEKVVEKMLDLGMIIDVSHCTPTARQQVYDIAGNTMHRVMASHVGAYGIKPTPYNLEDWEIKWMADHGGVVGVIFMNDWLNSYAEKMGLDNVSRTIQHVISVGGEDVVALGTDFDGFTDPPDDLIDSAEMPRLTQRLMSEYTGLGTRRYSDDVVKKILGGNVLRVIRNGWGMV